MDHSTTDGQEFDSYAQDYDAALARGLSVSGEDKEHFARGRITWLSEYLKRLRQDPTSVMDFGCGTGSAAPLLRDLDGDPRVVGVDTSAESLRVARQSYGAEGTQFFTLNDYRPNEEIDLAYCNGVFHHIPLDERAAAVNYVYRALRSGGVFAFWENNPWNPATRYVMSRIPFDRDAITLSPLESRRMLRAGGFEVLGTDFLFIFPRALRWLRFIEPKVAKMPLGTQYLVLCRKP